MQVQGTVRCAANSVPLSPISFLERSAVVYSDAPSLVYGDLGFTWKQTLHRCKSLASSLVELGISYGHVVAAFLPNIPPMYELHFAVPMAGAILCTLNIRHDSSMVSVLLRHSEAKLVFVDCQFLDVVQGAIKILSETTSNLPSIVLVNDPLRSTNTGCGFEYESLLSRGNPERFEVRRPKDEWDPISLNYTSGTTSSPKGVVYSHRGAYLNSLAAILLNQMGGSSKTVYLWTVPMFHCNGWCLTWATAALGATSVCLRAVSPDAVFSSIVRHQVTHMGGAPTVLNMIIHAPEASKKPLPRKVVVMVGGAPPPSQVIFKMEELGFGIIHSYGLTETYGPGTVCTQKPEWDSLPSDERLRMNARQGLNHVAMEAIDVKDPVTMRSVAWDAKTIGEVMLRGNTVMIGYLKDEKATLETFKGGWLRTGDLGVRHPDGYVELKDRSKDIIISGGENISTIEVESVLFRHPGVVDAAVVGRPDDHWGETPCAFVQLKDGCSVSAAELIGFCRDRLPHYMVPRSVVFDELPKTSTGKTQKFVLKEKTRAMGSLSKGGRSSKL